MVLGVVMFGVMATTEVELEGEATAVVTTADLSVVTFASSKVVSSPKKLSSRTTDGDVTGGKVVVVVVVLVVVVVVVELVVVVVVVGLVVVVKLVSRTGGSQIGFLVVGSIHGGLGRAVDVLVVAEIRETS